MTACLYLKQECRFSVYQLAKNGLSLINKAAASPVDRIQSLESFL